MSESRLHGGHLDLLGCFKISHNCFILQETKSWRIFPWLSHEYFHSMTMHPVLHTRWNTEHTVSITKKEQNIPFL